MTSSSGRVVWNTIVRSKAGVSTDQITTTRATANRSNRDQAGYRCSVANSMRDSVETIVRRAYEEAWNEGDLETLLQFADPDIVFQTSGAFPDLEPEYHGHEGMRRFWKTVRAPFERLHIEVARVVQRGDDILILFRFHALGRDGVELDARFANIGRMRDDLVTSIVAYRDWESAAAAAGSRLDDLDQGTT